MSSDQMMRRYQRRAGSRLADRLHRAFEPPLPLIHNPREPHNFPLGRWNLYIGGAGRSVEGYVNLDLFGTPEVDIVADAELLPFPEATFTSIECDAVLEHVRHPDRVMAEIARVVVPGGHVHLVTPFCHPFHEYPHDYRRFTLDGLKELAGDCFEVVAEGWRTGPSATLLVFTIEYAKLLLPCRWWRGFAHGLLGWILFPFRYLDLLFVNTPRAAILGNHCYLWLRKR